ncbi:MAG TPA: HAMP domain-containing sensor histidine kinase [Jatrophihabitans sp.]|uniref:sensor histidine kinase n=1 Tax=Jatrophihabitans sp. TaxID=1932789 RepID=UPI002E04D939|nr:HAMP domain-containing sensor histidine kinase [Jatrophihabitans sp.]
MSGVEYLPGQPGSEPYTPPPPTAPPPGEPGPSDPPPPYDPPYDEEPTGPPPARRHLGPRSLTARLVSGVVSLVTLLVVIIGTATYFALSSFLLDRLDQQLAPVVASNSGHLALCLRNNIQTCRLGDGVSGFRAPQTEWVTVLDQNGVPQVGVDSSPSLKALDLTDEQAQAVVDNPDGVRTIRTADGYELRVAARAFATPTTTYVVVSGLSTSEVHKTLRQLVLIEVLIGGGAILVALGATTFGVRFSLRRLREVTTTAQDVAAELSPEGAGLDRRVPVTEKDTEVGQLAESMNTLLGAVETQFAARLESEQRMRQFLADASHELRTPLTSIRGYAELARMQRAVGNPEEDNLSRIESEGTRMSRLIEDLLMLARGDGADRTVRTELIDVDDLLDDSVRGVRAAYPDRAIGIELGAVPQVIGDRDQLIRVVRNLVTNAAVHTRPERPILVRGSTVDDGVAIQVVDGGPGLAPEDAAHVFERFWRADKARTRARGGSGLGLSIVASIVRAHGGTVRFDSTVEGGSTVTVWLPGVQPG